MKTLPTEFSKNGFNYKLIERNSVAAIYSQSSEGRINGYEVIKVKVFPEREVMGKKVEAGEYYPGSEKWGTDAYTCGTLERALYRFNQFIVAKEEKDSRKPNDAVSDTTQA